MFGTFQRHFNPNTSLDLIFIKYMTEKWRHMANKKNPLLPRALKCGKIYANWFQHFKDMSIQTVALFFTYAACFQFPRL